MGRPLRLHLPGGFYHTTLRGNHREPIFSVDLDRRLLNSIVAAALEKQDARIHAYCWMTNHLHLLVQVGEAPLAGLMRRIASGYARTYQSNRQTTGHLFEKRYHAVLVDADAYLLALVRYIHLNPVRARLASGVDRYPWSSHHAYSGGPREPWLTIDFALRMFSEDRAQALRAYARFVDCKAADVPSPLEAVRADCPFILGDDAFYERIRGPLNLPPSRRTLQSLIEEASATFGLPGHLLAAALRNPRIAAARAWIARRALEGRIATLAEVARALHCDHKTIRRALEVCPDGAPDRSPPTAELAGDDPVRD